LQLLVYQHLCYAAVLALERLLTPDTTITCPNCGTTIKLTETLAGPFIESARKRLEAEAKGREDAVAARERDLAAMAAKVQQDQSSIHDQIAAKVEQEREGIAAQEAAKAKLSLQSDLSTKERLIADLSATIRQLNDKLGTAQQAEAEFRRKERELEDAKREVALSIEKQVTGQLAVERERARKQADEEHRLSDAEKDMKMAAMIRQIEDLKRRAEQGSQQLQGEVQELNLESILQTKFPRDTFEPIAKGERGADVLHRISGPLGQACGCILWESKRTRNWSDSWLPKLREDQRTAKAEIAVIVTQALPKGVETFDHVDGVWVTSSQCAIPVAVALRQSLIELSAARQAGEGMESKRDLVYQYVTGPRFRQRVQAIVEAFSDMHEDLDKERKAITKMWAKREEQIERVMQGTVGVYGDLQGIAGKSLQEIEGLDLKRLE
jgi:hypothetical protein